MTVYSYSRINTYQTCPYQYKLQYIDKIKIEEEGIEAFMGSRVHETLEKLYSDLILSKMTPLDELLEYYNKKWSETWHDKVMVVKKGYTPDDYKRAGEKAIRDYYEHYHPFDQTKPLWTEKLVLFDLGNVKYKMQGYIDRLDRRADGNLEIHDYKGSGRLPGQDRIDKDKQLALYQIAVLEKFPEVEGIELVWHYVLFDEELRSKRSVEQLDKLKAEYRALIDEIEDTKTFETRKSKLCDWCGYQEYCPTKKHIMKLEDFSEDERISDDGFVLVNKYADLIDQEKELRSDIDDVKEKLIKFAKENEFNIIRGTDKYVRVTLKEENKLPSRSSDSETFEELVRIIHDAGLWDDLASLDTRRLMKELESGTIPDDIKSKLEQHIISEEKVRVNLGTLNSDDEVNE